MLFRVSVEVRLPHSPSPRKLARAACDKIQYHVRSEESMQCYWGILGPGYIATRAVIPAIQQVPNAYVLAVASSNKERARGASAQFGIERTYDSYQALLDDPDVHA